MLNFQGMNWSVLNLFAGLIMFIRARYSVVLLKWWPVESWVFRMMCGKYHDRERDRQDERLSVSDPLQPDRKQRVIREVLRIDAASNQARA